jgi:hypothetical protein
MNEESRIDEIDRQTRWVFLAVRFTGVFALWAALAGIVGLFVFGFDVGFSVPLLVAGNIGWPVFFLWVTAEGGFQEFGQNGGVDE